MQIDPRKKTISQVDSVVEDLKGDSASIDSEVEVLSSRAVALKVIDILNLRDDEEFRPQSKVRRIFEILGLSGFLPPKQAEEPSNHIRTERRLDQDPNGTLVGKVQRAKRRPSATNWRPHSRTASRFRACA